MRSDHAPRVPYDRWRPLLRAAVHEAAPSPAQAARELMRKRLSCHGCRTSVATALFPGPNLRILPPLGGRVSAPAYGHPQRPRRASGL